MVAATNEKKQPAKRDPRQVFPVSLRKAERELGYTRAHISRVIRGQRVSPPTLKAYQALCAREGVE